jgi:predicted transcriptional regulator
MKQITGLTIEELMEEIDFRKSIQKACDDMGITIYTLATKAGLKSPSTLYNYLNGVSSLSSDNLSKVLEYLRTHTN